MIFRAFFHRLGDEILNLLLAQVFFFCLIIIGNTLKLMLLSHFPPFPIADSDTTTEELRYEQRYEQPPSASNQSFNTFKELVTASFHVTSALILHYPRDLVETTQTQNARAGIRKHRRTRIDSLTALKMMPAVAAKTQNGTNIVETAEKKTQTIEGNVHMAEKATQTPVKRLLETAI